jgi:uncharacterized protein
MSRPLSDLTINISRLSEGSHEYDFETEPKNLDLDARFVDRVFVHAVLEKTGRQLFLRTKLGTKGHFVCDRCLDDFVSDVSTRYDIVYITEEIAAPEIDQGEMQYLGPDSTTLDLGEDVRQFLILAVPLKLLCKEDCRGLCPKCGSNRNKSQCGCAENDADPRWEVLKKVSLK